MSGAAVQLRATLAERGVDVDLSVADGETVAVLGPNGAGKSTLLGMLAGLIRPDTGRATLGDDVLFDLPGSWTPPHRRGVALLAQEPLLFPHLTVRQNVEFGPRAARASRADARSVADGWLRRVGVDGFAARRPDELSGGQAQRVAVARALAAEPRLLLLDEPLSALDVAVTGDVRQTLARALDGRTAVIVSHDALDAYLLADRVIVLHDGRIVDDGPVRDVLDRPRRAFTAELTGVTLLTGRRTASGIVTDDGLSLAATVVEAAAPGDRVAAAVRPSSVRVLAAEPGTATANLISAVVTGLEPRADLVLVRTDALPALVAPSIVADLALAPGTPVTLAVSPDDLRVYPA
ncbi:molybdenum ABC transporter ATP-binding protein [Leifsonia sp. Root227]|uniref:sulfate/molybdate ABC transporter ATP-binding protein n=1 Tax=Leifsonia sp. Root227 TaxID=1736496 RepID=UPI0006FA9A94|nr:ABC transporter ATP-binding protein [Leifsonia sp. Root227]KRC50591.1 molybdenum ABC transporter ATP-binding protein [Leifsonia sp. Root227]